MRAWLVPNGRMDSRQGPSSEVTKAVMNGKPVQTCTLALPDVDHESLTKSFFARTDAEKIAEERDATRVWRLYILIAGGRERMRPADSSGVSVVKEPVIVASSIVAD